MVLEDKVNNNDGIFLWNTLTVDDGDYELRLIATDDDGLTSTAYLSLITINNFVSVNHNPEIISIPITKALVNEDYVYDVNAIDQDNDVLIYSFIVNPSGMDINQNTGLITWHPIVLGSYNVKVMVEDGKGGADAQEFTVNVDTEIVVPPFQPKEAHIHKFSINNVILINNNEKLNVYAYIRNYGTEDEKINLRATIMENGMNKITALSLDSNDNRYGILSFDNLNNGHYVVKVEAFNSKHYEVRYAYITI